MRKKLTKIGDRLALILDKRLLHHVGIDENTLLDVSTDGDVIVVSPVRDKRRRAKLKSIIAAAHARHGGVFRRLGE
jgi:antitoxin MazE